MGQAARINRTGRFIKEFAKDIKKVKELDTASSYKYLGGFLGARDADEQAVFVHKFQDEAGVEHIFEEQTPLFDPEYWSDLDTIEYVAEALGAKGQVAVDAVIARLKKAELID